MDIFSQVVQPVIENGTEPGTFVKLPCHFLRKFIGPLIAELMLQAGSEVHGDGADLDFHLCHKAPPFLLLGILLLRKSAGIGAGNFQPLHGLPDIT